MLKIRMTKTGTKNAQRFRVVATDVRSARDGKNIEILGWYNPSEEEGKNAMLKFDRIEHWKSKGAQVSEAVEQLIARVNMTPEKREAYLAKRTKYKAKRNDVKAAE